MAEGSDQKSEAGGRAGGRERGVCHYRVCGEGPGCRTVCRAIGRLSLVRRATRGPSSMRLKDQAGINPYYSCACASSASMVKWNMCREVLVVHPEQAIAPCLRKSSWCVLVGVLSDCTMPAHMVSCLHGFLPLPPRSYRLSLAGELCAILYI